MGRMVNGLVAAVLACMLAAPGAAAGEKPEKCFLWKVGSDTASVYLLGSIHMSSEKMYPLCSVIEDAYGESDVLVVELDMSEGKRALAAVLMLQKGTYPGEKTIEDNLSAESVERLSAHLKTRGMSLAMVNKMKPWYLGLILVMGEYMRLGYDPGMGLDLYFIGRAAAQKKKILELESVAEQIAVLGGGSKEEQELSLLETLEQLPNAAVAMEKMIDAWTAGDADGMNRILRENLSKNPALEPFRKRLLDDRNVTMADAIEGYLKTAGTYFVVVGGGHFVGEKGIVKLLRERNHSVEQLEKRPGERENAPGPREGIPSASRNEVMSDRGH